jgi:hypothetical protein
VPVDVQHHGCHKKQGRVMKELWIAEAMDQLQEEVPMMTDEHAKDTRPTTYTRSVAHNRCG